MPESFDKKIKKLQELKNANPNGADREQYMNTLSSLIDESEVVRYYSKDDMLVYLPFWKSMKSPRAVEENVLGHAKDDKGISILCKSGLEGDPYVITLDKDGKLVDVSDGPVPVEEAMKRFNGPAEPKKPTFGDRLHHWFKNSFFAGLFWKADRTDAVEAYEQYEKDKETFRSKAGYTPDYEIGKKKQEAEEAEKEVGKEIDADEVEPDLSVKEPLDTEVSPEVQAKALTAKPICRMLSPSKLGYKVTGSEECAMLANMPGLDRFAKPEKLSDSLLADDWQAYSEFTSKIIEAGKNDIKVTGLIDKMSGDGSLRELYGAYKTNYFNNRTIDLESALSEAVTGIGGHPKDTVDITSHLLKGSTYNPQADRKQDAAQQNGLGSL